MRPDHPLTPMGCVEIAQHFGVQPKTVHQWVRRGHLPEPTWICSGTRLWSRDAVLQLADRWRDAGVLPAGVK